MSESVRVNVSLPRYVYEDYLIYKDRINLSGLLRQALQEELGMLEMLDNKCFSSKKLGRFRE